MLFYILIAFLSQKINAFSKVNQCHIKVIEEGVSINPNLVVYR